MSGILEDLFGNTRTTGWKIFTKHNRLRGVGWIVVLVAAVACFVYVLLHLRLDVGAHGGNIRWSTVAPPPLRVDPGVVIPPPPPPRFEPGTGFAFAR